MEKNFVVGPRETIVWLNWLGKESRLFLVTAATFAAYSINELGTLCVNVLFAESAVSL